MQKLARTTIYTKSVPPNRTPTLLSMGFYVATPVIILSGSLQQGLAYYIPVWKPVACRFGIIVVEKEVVWLQPDYKERGWMLVLDTVI